MAGPSNPNHPGYPWLEKLIFGKRGVVLAIFTIITALMIFETSKLEIDNHDHDYEDIYLVRAYFQLRFGDCYSDEQGH